MKDFNKKSALGQLINRTVENYERLLVSQQITPWVVGFAIRQLEIKQFDGRIISYRGITFDGTPRKVFWWNYIEPFLEDITLRTIQEIKKVCSENFLDFRIESSALSNKLKEMYRNIFDEMARADQLMRGTGFSKNEKKDVRSQIDRMDHFLEDRLNMEIPKRYSFRNLKRILSKFWHDSVWSKVIAEAISSLVNRLGIH